MLITEYFHNLESEILQCVHVVESNIVKDQRSLHIGLIEGRLVFSDASALHFIEFVSVKRATEVYKYSYHYQDREGVLLFRYDSAPHHREILTFPYHKHIPENEVIDSIRPTLSEVLDEIEKMVA